MAKLAKLAKDDHDRQTTRLQCYPTNLTSSNDLLHVLLVSMDPARSLPEMLSVCLVARLPQFRSTVRSIGHVPPNVVTYWPALPDKLNRPTFHNLAHRIPTLLINHTSPELPPNQHNTLYRRPQPMPSPANCYRSNHARHTSFTNVFYHNLAS